jgi:hypothetical protein
LNERILGLFIELLRLIEVLFEGEKVLIEAYRES